MINIKNTRTLDGKITDVIIPSKDQQTLDAKGELLLFPGLIDPHIWFGNPVQNLAWSTAINSSLNGGFTTAIELPSPDNPRTSLEQLNSHSRLSSKFFTDLHNPLRYFQYATGSQLETNDFGQIRKSVKGVIISVHSHEELDESWNEFFQHAAWEDLLVVINTKGENLSGPHSNAQAKSLLEKAIEHAERNSTRLCVFNVTTTQELNLIAKARDRELLVYAETTPKQLFDNSGSPSADHLWQAIEDRLIDMIGSGYNAVWSTEKPLIEEEYFSPWNPQYILPLLLQAHAKGKISLERIVQTACSNPEAIFEFNRELDFVLVDPEKEQNIEIIENGSLQRLKLRGTVVHTIVQGHILTANVP
jgi:dihydroorotase